MKTLFLIIIFASFLNTSQAQTSDYTLHTSNIYYHKVTKDFVNIIETRWLDGGKELTVHISGQDLNYQYLEKMATIYEGSIPDALKFMNNVEIFYNHYGPGDSKLIDGRIVSITKRYGITGITIYESEKRVAGKREYTLKKWIKMKKALISYASKHDI